MVKEIFKLLQIRHVPDTKVIRVKSPDKIQTIHTFPENSQNPDIYPDVPPLP